eukprot:EG_transcript_23104
MDRVGPADCCDSLRSSDCDKSATPQWLQRFAEARLWYHYRCSTLKQSRFLSAANLSAAPTAEHRWQLSDEAPEWTSVRCAACGAAHHPGRHALAAPPPWCPACGSDAPSWVPVTEQPFLTITWFRFLCMRCGRPSILGNEPQPYQCIRCHTRDPSALQPLPSLLPVPLPSWNPHRHWGFPPSFRRLVKVLLWAASREEALCWMPRDLMLLVLPFLVPYSIGAPDQCAPCATPAASEAEQQ